LKVNINKTQPYYRSALGVTILPVLKAFSWQCDMKKEGDGTNLASSSSLLTKVIWESLAERNIFGTTALMLSGF
jgi:hypothetical protein